MADPKLQFAKPVPQSMIARVLSGVKYAFTGKADFFPPMDPIAPVVQEPEAAGVTDRAWDYTVGINLQLIPRQEEVSSFEALRRIVQNLDIIGLIIETCKDEMTGLEWEIRAREGQNVSKSKLKALNDFFIYPDRRHAWDEWLRMLLDDVYVIDAATLCPRMTKGGELYSLDQIDGSMIKPMVDVTGRRPDPPAPAYLHVLKGVPAVYYSADELMYFPRNPRVYKLYGFSPVEQTILTANIALRRAIHKLQYYTEGNTPDLIFQVPDGWTVDQIKQYDFYFNSILAGNTGERRKAKFVPAGMKPVDTKEHALKDDFDEWIARILCYALSRSPAPFVKQMNRATAGEQAEAAKREGNMPYMVWTKRRVDFVLRKYMQAGDCEFGWKENKDPDPQVQAAIDQIYVNIGVQQPEQVANARGFDWQPLPEPNPEPAHVTEQLQPPGENPVPKAAPENGSENGSEKTTTRSEKLQKIAGGKKLKKLTPIPFDRPATKKAIRKLKKTVGAFLAGQAKEIAEKLSSAYAVMEKAAKEKSPLDQAIDDLDFQGWAVLWEPIVDQLQSIFEDSGIESLSQFGIEDEGITDLVMDQAVSYAKDRAAQMVGMRFDKATGELVQNPNPAFAITESTRDMLRQLVTTSLEEGPSSQELADQIMDSTAFSEARADTIARTELAMAHSEGSLEGYREARDAGVLVYKEWLDSDGCEECAQNADAGPIDLDDIFPSGDDAPPAHPNCRCSISPVTVSEEDVDTGEEPYK